MRTEYKYIYFTKAENKPKTSVWHCMNKNSDDFLGKVKWYGAWRQYCFMPDPNTVFNKGCMEDINSFIDQPMEDHKKNKEAAK